MRPGPLQDALRRLTHWLLVALVAGFVLSSSLSARPTQQRLSSTSVKSNYAALIASKYSQPYLTVVGPNRMRFASPLPDFSPELALANTEGESDPSEDLALADDSAATPALSDQSARATAPVIAPPPVTSEPARVVPPEPSGPAPMPILPDDLERRVTPEDFLPFFLPPRIPSAPPSQATYQQK